MLKKIKISLIIVLFLPVISIAGPVVVTIKPLHSLVAGVMQGIGTPELLIADNQSPHGFQLKPSQRKLLSDASVLFYTHDNFEVFLQRVDLQEKQLQRVALAEVPGIELLPVRQVVDNKIMVDSEHYDLHLWLSPNNAMVMVDSIAEVLSQYDEANRQDYQENASLLKARLKSLDDELKESLAPVSLGKFMVFHDAYQYIEKSYGLEVSNVITIDTERTPGVKRLRQLRQQLQDQEISCVFSEPQFDNKLLDSIIEETLVRHGELDPLGSAQPPGREAYFAMMRELADGIVKCLNP